jgi:hypothetical protein
MNGTAAVVGALTVMLAAAGGVGWWIWGELADVQMSRHGWIALGLGATVTTLLGVGLMYLVYYSSRHGYDDEAGRD